MLQPDFSFVVHTRNPVTDDEEEAYIEIAVGLGETLASANQYGTPYRLVYHKTKNWVRIDSFASYSFALFADPKGQEMRRERIDYSKVVYS